MFVCACLRVMEADCVCMYGFESADFSVLLYEKERSTRVESCDGSKSLGGHLRVCARADLSSCIGSPTVKMTGLAISSRRGDDFSPEIRPFQALSLCVCVCACVHARASLLTRWCVWQGQ